MINGSKNTRLSLYLPACANNEVVAPEMLCQQADRDPAESAGRPSRTGSMPHMLPAVSKESFPLAVNPGA